MLTDIYDTCAKFAQRDEAELCNHTSLLMMRDELIRSVLYNILSERK
jgi:hypothetical protein